MNDLPTQTPDVDPQAPVDLPPADPADNRLEVETVKRWTSIIKKAKTYFDEDFKRMRSNMDFAAGLQYEGQDKMEEDRYIANFITHQTNQKTATLYAKNPKAEWKKRKRLEYQLWDGKVESLWAAAVELQRAAMEGPSPMTIQAQMMMQDYQRGQQVEKQYKKMGETLEILYQYECDTQEPDFKLQMKQLVRRTVITGVGFVRLNYFNNLNHVITSANNDDSIVMRLKRAKYIMSQIQEDKVQEDDPRMEELRLLLTGAAQSVQTNDTDDLQESLEFDFLSSTSIIVDPKCQSLKGFIGADWIAIEFLLELDEANAYFELSGTKAITTDADTVIYDNESKQEVKESLTKNNPKDETKKPMGRFFEVFNRHDKTHFFICDGYKFYVQEPQALNPPIKGFWPVFSLTFNDVEPGDGSKARVYPPSDVQLLKPMQKEVNRERQQLREHRTSNSPFFLTTEGWLTEEDEEKLSKHENNEIVKFKATPPGGDLKSAIVQFQPAPIDAAVYNTDPILADAAMVTGQQQQVGQKTQRNVAATPAVIQEQSRVTEVSSNVDDLDDLLTQLSNAGGEMIIRAFQNETVQKIVGPGAAILPDDRSELCKNLFLQTVAASSGRPNKAIDVQNAQQLVPLMLNAGANPWGIIQYVAKTLDANLNPTDFAPVAPPQQPQQGVQQHQVPQHSQQQRHPGVVGQHQGGQPMPAGTQQGGLH